MTEEEERKLAQMFRTDMTEGQTIMNPNPQRGCSSGPSEGNKSLSACYFSRNSEFIPCNRSALKIPVENIGSPQTASPHAETPVKSVKR
jgi:hypothetical protein